MRRFSSRIPLAILPASAILVALVCASGCKKGTEAVSVDVDSVLAKQPALKRFGANVPTPPEPQAARTVTLPGQPAREMTTLGKDTGEVRRLIREQQEETRKRLERQLRDFYARDASRFEISKLRDLDAAEVARYKEIDARIRAEFERISDRRGRQLAALSVLVGFPDPNPDPDQAGEPPNGAVSRKRFEKAQDLRQRIREIDAAFQAFVRAQTQGIEDLAASERTRILAEIETEKAKLDRQAEIDAAARVREAERDLRLKLVDATRISLPAQPGQTVELAAQKPLRPAPEVPSESVFGNRDHRRALLESELRVWLGLRRYHLDPKARDATSEFETWRDDPNGPSAK
ncbi:hypothetical protein BH11ARM2_BH11ARM2_05880 [soil metagenome]